MAAEPLTKDEAAWLRKVQSLLRKCPSDRFGFYTIGDPNVTVYDADVVTLEVADASGGEFCNVVDEAGAHLGDLVFPNNVDATAG